jgi:hypothetical protein
MATRIKTTPLGRTTVRESTGQIARVAPAPIKTDTPVRPSVKRLEGTGLTAQDTKTLTGKTESELNVNRANDADKLGGLDAENFTKTMHYDYIDTLDIADHPDSIDNMLYVGNPDTSWNGAFTPEIPEAYAMDKCTILGVHNSGATAGGDDNWQIIFPLNFNGYELWVRAHHKDGAWTALRRLVTSSKEGTDLDPLTPNLNVDAVDGYHAADIIADSQQFFASGTLPNVVDNEPVEHRLVDRYKIPNGKQGKITAIRVWGYYTGTTDTDIATVKVRLNSASPFVTFNMLGGTSPAYTTAEYFTPVNVVSGDEITVYIPDSVASGPWRYLTVNIEGTFQRYL